MGTWSYYKPARVFVSDQGDVKSIDTENDILKDITPKEDYRGLYIEHAFYGNTTNVYVHDMVATLFVANKRGGVYVRHKDGNILNNDSDNLFWDKPF